MSKHSNLKYTVIRPPLLFGIGVQANFLKLIKLIKSNFPIPLGAIKNKRSFMYIENFSTFIYECIFNDLSDNKIFNVSDPYTISTISLIKLMSKILNKKLFILKIPKIFLEIIFFLIGKHNDYKKLTDTLIVDPSYTYNHLGWEPPYDINYSLSKTILNIE